MAFYEQIIQLPTFCLTNQRWTKNFSGHTFFNTTKKDMAKDVLGIYEMFDTAKSWYDKSALQDTQQKEKGVFHKWNECFNDFDPRKSNSSTAKILENTTVKLQDFIKDLNRSIICIDDIRSVLTNKHKFRIIYTDNDTYLTKDPTFEPVEEVEGLSLFEGL
jgi:hypothetical protein